MTFILDMKLEKHIYPEQMDDNFCNSEAKYFK